jgi:hypothetical protein
MWTVSIVIVAMIFFPYMCNVLNRSTSYVYSSFYITSFRSFWAMSLAWLIFALETGSAKWLRDLLSHRFWSPFGKLGLSLYLVHPTLQYALIISQKNAMNFDTLQMVNLNPIQ